MGREQSIMVLQEDALSKLAMSLSMTTLATLKKTHTQHPPPLKKKNWERDSPLCLKRSVLSNLAMFLFMRTLIGCIKMQVLVWTYFFRNTFYVKLTYTVVFRHLLKVCMPVHPLIVFLHFHQPE